MEWTLLELILVEVRVDLSITSLPRGWPLLRRRFFSRIHDTENPDESSAELLTGLAGRYK